MEEEDCKRLAVQGERIRKSEALGKSPHINRLFDLLLERSIAGGTPPKEIEIARVVFGKSSDVDLAADATVRVHIHRLRKKLEELAPDENGERIVLPRGQYRLVVAGQDPAPVDTGAADPGFARRGLRWLAAGLVLLLGLNLSCWIWFNRHPIADPRLGTSFWRALASSPNPTLVVYGDQYVFGELDAKGGVFREVAELGVNSRDDLEQLKRRETGAAQRYIDINAYHLPEGVAPAFGSIAPVLMAARGASAEAVRSLAMSRMTNDMLRNHDLVYVGLLGSLGDLKEPLSDISGFALVTSDDTIVDRASGHRYQSDWADPSTEGIMRRDYAYLASLPGPAGHHIVVIAGTRDPALMEAIQIASNKADLDGLRARLGNDDAFEALYEVRTFGPSNVGNKLVIARNLEMVPMWPERDRSAPAPAAKDGAGAGNH